MAAGYYDGGETTGFVSPAGDALEGPIDLSAVLDLSRPSPYAVRTLRPLWRRSFRYFKVGVVLDDLRDAATEPRSLFPTRDPAKSARLMAALDAVNARYGRGALRRLATGLARPWGTRNARLSPRCYTTRLDKVMEARAW